MYGSPIKESEGGKSGGREGVREKKRNSNSRHKKKAGVGVGEESNLGVQWKGASIFASINAEGDAN